MHRSFRRAAGLGVALVLVVAACGDDDDAGTTAPASSAATTSATTTPTASTAAATTAATGSSPAATSGDNATTTEGTTADTVADVLRPVPTDADTEASGVITYSGAPGTLDPHRVAGPGEWAFLFPVYDRLVQIDDKYQVQPMLATSWTFAPDGSSLTLTLRKDATFGDGSPVDAAAVKASLDRARTLAQSTVANSLSTVTNVEVVDPGTVKIDLSGGGANLLALFSQPAGMIINPKAIADPTVDLAQGPGPGMGSGPYEATSITPGSAGVVTYVQRPDHDKYWDKAAGLFKQLTINNVPTSAQRINVARAGDSDLSQITGVEVAQAKQLVDSGQQAGILYPQTLTVQSVQFRATRPPLDNAKFREAVAYAIDKKSIADQLYSGLCTVTDQPYAAGHWAHDDAVAKVAPSFDPAKAKQLLAESGVTDPSFELIFSPLYGPQSQVLQAQLASVGINLTVTPSPTQAGGPSFAKGDFDSQWFPQTNSVDPSQMINDWYLGVVNLIPEADRAKYEPIAEAGADVTKTQAERADALKPFWTDLAQDVFTVPICTASQVWLQSGKLNLDGMLYSWSGLNDFRYIYKVKG